MPQNNGKVQAGMTDGPKKIAAAAKASVRELAKAHWRASGLTDADAKCLGFQALTGEETKALDESYYAVASLLIPYFDLKGVQTGFHRIRYLEALPGFAGVVEKPQRYAQKPKSLNEAYYAPLGSVSWEDVVKDAGQPLLITEGEKKAAAATALGRPCIGLGGVDVWRASKRGLPILPSLEEIMWRGREVTIVYDSDAATNLNVVRAQRQLAKELAGRGAMVSVASLPPKLDGAKQGLDDFLLTEGIDGLTELVTEASRMDEADALWRLSEEVVYIQDPGLVIVRTSGQRLDPGKFVAHHFSHWNHIESVVSKEGVVKRAKKSTARRWLEWECRPSLERLAYTPGGSKVVDGCWNLWPGWGCEPKSGYVDPWCELLEYLFRSDPQHLKWFEQWCAYPIQHPGTKHYVATLLWSRATGTGKTLAAYMLMGVYGKNAVEIKNKDLRGGFNGWAKNKQFIYGDEISGQDARIDSDWLKGLITQQTIQINEKYVPQYVLIDHANYLLASNHPDSLFLEDSDRRYFVHEIVGDPAKRAFYEGCHKWLHGAGSPGSYEGQGASALFDHLLHVDLTGFNPRERAPVTAAKTSMTLDGKSDLGMWCVQLREDPITALRPLGTRSAAGCDLFTPSMLLRAYDPEGSKRVTSNGVSREMARANFRRVNGGEPIRTSVGVVRLFAVRNPKQWVLASPTAVAAHFETFFGSTTAKY